MVRIVVGAAFLFRRVGKGRKGRFMEKAVRKPFFFSVNRNVFVRRVLMTLLESHAVGLADEEFQNDQLAQHRLLQPEWSGLHRNRALCREGQKALEVFPCDGRFADLSHYVGRQLLRTMTSEGQDGCYDTQVTDVQ